MPQYQIAYYYAPPKGTWRIYWYNRNPQTGQLQRITKTFDLNRITDKPERRRVAKEYVTMINEALRKGYNYFVDSLYMLDDDNGTISITQLIKNMLPVLTAGRKKRTVETYNSYADVFTKWLAAKKYNYIPAHQFKPAKYIEFVNYKLAAGHGNNNINDYTSFFKSLFKKAVKLAMIDKNPLDAVDMLPIQESTLFEALTAEELARIAPALIAHNPYFYLYTKFTAHEFIRPYHTARLRVRDLQFENGLIALNNTTTKNNKVVYKQLFPDMVKLLLQLGYDKVPGHWYLFGKGFLPAEKLHASLSNRAAELWRKLVIDGLGINKKMYALKHTGAQYYLTENEHIDTGFLQKHMEHSTLNETEHYISKRAIKMIDTKNVKLLKY